MAMSSESSDFGVWYNCETLVPPAETMPRHTLYLSNLDDLVTHRALVKVFFTCKPNVNYNYADGIVEFKAFLSRFLVPFYPFAGRLKETSNGKLVVDCNGVGAFLVESYSDATIQDFGDSVSPKPFCKKLFYDWKGPITDAPPLIFQITTLKCGGFVLAMSICHALCDGTGLVHIIRSIVEMYLGLLEPSVPPCWAREALKPRPLPAIKFPHHEYAEIEDRAGLCQLLAPQNLVVKSFCFTPTTIRTLKSQIMREDGKNCTSFQVLSAMIWRFRTKALNLSPSSQLVRLSFSVNIRSKLKPPLPKGFYGNAIVLTSAICTAAELVERPLSYATKLVQDAIAIVDDEYIRSAIDYLEVHKPIKKPLTATILVSEIFRLGYKNFQITEGEVKYGGILDHMDEIPELVIVSSTDWEGNDIEVRLALPSPAMQEFARQVQALFPGYVSGEARL